MSLHGSGHGDVKSTIMMSGELEVSWLAHFDPLRLDMGVSIYSSVFINRRSYVSWWSDMLHEHVDHGCLEEGTPLLDMPAQRHNIGQENSVESRVPLGHHDNTGALMVH